MPLAPALLAATAVSTATAVTATATGGPDLLGVAAIIGAAASAFGMIVTTVITLLRYLRAGNGNSDELEDVIDNAVAKALRERGQEP